MTSGFMREAASVTIPLDPAWASYARRTASMVCIRTSGVLHTSYSLISETLSLHGIQIHNNSVLGCQVQSTQQSIIAAIV